MEMTDSRLTAEACIREIVRVLPSGGNPEALFAELPLAEQPPHEWLCTVLERLDFQAQYLEAEAPGELYLQIGMPVMLQLANGNWVIFLGLRSPLRQGDSEQVVLFDPLTQAENKMLFVPKGQFERNWHGRAILVRSRRNASYAADGRLTAFYAFCAIARQCGVEVDVARLRHESAIETAEPDWRELQAIAGRYGLKSRAVKFDWTKLRNLQEAFPVLVEKKNGQFAVLCGFRAAADGEVQAAVWDPAPPPGETPGVHYWKQAQYEEVFAERQLLLKRTYSLLDEKQPFGLSWFVPEFWKQRRLFLEVVLAMLAISAIGLVTPLFFQIVVDKVLVHESYRTLNVLGVGIVVVLLFNAVLEGLRDYLLLFCTNKIDIRTAARTFLHMLNLPVGFFEQMPAGVLIKHMQQTDKIRNFLSGNLFFTMIELISLAVFIPFLFIYSWQLTLVVLAFSLMMALIIACLIRPFQRRLQELYLAEGQRQSMLVESINGIRTVKSLALEPAQIRKWNDTAAYAITRYFNVGKISMTARVTSQLLEKLMVVAIIWIGALAVFDKEITVGALIAFQMLAGRVTGPLVRLVGLVHEYQQTALSVKMLGQVMNAPPEQVGGRIRQPLKGEISFENVTFQYTPDSVPAIRNFSLRIRPGEVVGLVGRSGSGKTTLTKLLQGLYPLQQGLIKFDGIDLREIDRAHLRANIGVVLQDNFIFSGTIRDNIALTKKDASMEEIIYVSRLAGAEEFIQKLGRGYDSVLEENGANLSGGQRQRLAIARALLPNPRILIFDEATSALDPESEELIRANLRMICRERTVIIVSHRLSMVMGADNIVILDGGELRDAGTHRQLLQREGIYHDFWVQQQGGMA